MRPLWRRERAKPPEVDGGWQRAVAGRWKAESARISVGRNGSRSVLHTLRDVNLGSQLSRGPRSSLFRPRSLASCSVWFLLCRDEPPARGDRVAEVGAVLASPATLSAERVRTIVSTAPSPATVLLPEVRPRGAALGPEKNFCCHRPGCYERFARTARSPRQKFCSAACRQALRRVLVREARWWKRFAAYDAESPRLDASRDGPD
jgi:hypothetical protein